MGYLEKLLGQNEKVVFRTRRHFFVIFGALLKEILFLIILLAGFLYIRIEFAGQVGWISLVFVAAGILIFLSMMIDIIRWRSEEYIVTTRRVIHTTGVFNKHIVDSSLNKINDVILSQSWAGRMFGYGTIKILTATEEVINYLDRIHDPVGFKHAMLESKSAMEPIGAPNYFAQPSATQLLEELSDLKARQMISEAEYEEKRKEILKRM
jgi:uncharacterized membrane protein YdbT with pleckstrin-like domain